MRMIRARCGVCCHCAHASGVLAANCVHVQQYFAIYNIDMISYGI